jgi:hypothetical protein
VDGIVKEIVNRDNRMRRHGWNIVLHDIGREREERFYVRDDTTSTVC